MIVFVVEVNKMVYFGIKGCIWEYCWCFCFGIFLGCYFGNVVSVSCWNMLGNMMNDGFIDVMVMLEI